MDQVEIFRFLAAKSAIGPTALVTLTRVSGSSMRNPGSHLAVAADGEWRGSLAGGCIEAAVISEAMDAIREGAPREVRFGQGSRYIDIRLPCGGSLDVLISPLADPTIGALAKDMLNRRQPFALHLPLGGGGAEVEPGLFEWRTLRTSERFSVSHFPPLEVVVVGHGASVEALERQARTAGAITRVLTPDRDIASRMSAAAVSVTLLRTPTDTAALTADRWTAIPFVFHDHEWETVLMAHALATRAFYVGAMGSRTAQAHRATALAYIGVSLQDIQRLRAPIGIIPSSRDPQVLALSALAEIVHDFGQATERPDLIADQTGKHRHVGKMLSGMITL